MLLIAALIISICSSFLFAQTVPAKQPKLMLWSSSTSFVMTIYFASAISTPAD